MERHPLKEKMDQIHRHIYESIEKIDASQYEHWMKQKNQLIQEVVQHEELGKEEKLMLMNYFMEKHQENEKKLSEKKETLFCILKNDYKTQTARAGYQDWR